MSLAVGVVSIAAGVSLACMSLVCNVRECSRESIIFSYGVFLGSIIAAVLCSLMETSNVPDDNNASDDSSSDDSVSDDEMDQDYPYREE